MSDTDAQVPLPDLNAAPPRRSDDVAYHEERATASRIPPRISRPSSTCRCRFPRCSAAPRWISANC